MRYAPLGAFEITLNCLAIVAVRVNALAFITPTPPAAGQISLLISFVCHVWCPLPRSVPFFSTIAVQAVTLSRQNAHPLREAAMNRVAMSRFFASFRKDPVVKIPSSSIAVPAFSIVITLRSASV